MVACPVCHTAYDDAAVEVCSRCGSDMNARPRAGPEGAVAWRAVAGPASRRRWTPYAAPMLLLVLTTAALATYRLLGSPPAQAEAEPNDQPRTANLLTRNTPVAGLVNAPRSEDEPDLDYYRIPAGEEERAVTAHVTGIPDVDLVLELYDDTGARLAKVDGGGAGEGEFLGPVAVGRRDAYLRARPLWTAGQPPTQGSNTPYALTVDWFTPRGETELEPNDSAADATAISTGGAIRGHLSSANDQDWFELRVPAGSIVDGEVGGIDGVDVVVLMGARTRVDDGGMGEDEVFTATPGTDGLVVLGITERTARGGARKTAVAQRDEPYTLELRVRPASERRP